MPAMKVLQTSPSKLASVAAGAKNQDAEWLLLMSPIARLREAEYDTRRLIDSKSVELRQLIGNRYRDLIDSADTILSMTSSCESISQNVSSVWDLISFLWQNPRHADRGNENLEGDRGSRSRKRLQIYGIACRVKYLVDTPENIWGCLDESLFLEAAARYLRSKHVQCLLLGKSSYSSCYSSDAKILGKFSVLQHQWQIVESFKSHISVHSLERLVDGGRRKIGDYVDALAADAIIDELEPSDVLRLFLESRLAYAKVRIECSVLDM